MNIPIPEMPEAWRKKHTDRGLIECPDCQASGFHMSEKVVAALDLANDGKFDDFKIEETYCKRCNGLGWLRPPPPVAP